MKEFFAYLFAKRCPCGGVYVDGGHGGSKYCCDECGSLPQHKIRNFWLYLSMYRSAVTGIFAAAAYIIGSKIFAFILLIILILVLF